jgi:hypothetical protein
MKNAKQMAFPTQVVNGELHTGLTKREYFAAMAMQGLISKQGELNNAEIRARMAVIHADELLKALESKSE